MDSDNNSEPSQKKVDTFTSLDKVKLKEQSQPKPLAAVPTWLNVLMLFFISTMNLGNYYCYDIPQALQSPLREKLGITTEQTQLLYTVYSIPNTFLPFFGGI